MADSSRAEHPGCQRPCRGTVPSMAAPSMHACMQDASAPVAYAVEAMLRLQGGSPLLQRLHQLQRKLAHGQLLPAGDGPASTRHQAIPNKVNRHIGGAGVVH